MKIISLWQPWSSLFVRGVKKVETRSWAFPFPLPCVVAIHAAKRWNAGLLDLCMASSSFGAIVATQGFRWAGRRTRKPDIPFGAVVGAVRIVGCHDTAWLAAHVGSDDGRPIGLIGSAMSHTELALGDYSPGRFGWVADRFLELAEPLPLAGHQSFWDWTPTPEVEEWPASVLEALSKAREGLR